jgi:hypothetical protein
VLQPAAANVALRRQVVASRMPGGPISTSVVVGFAGENLWGGMAAVRTSSIS